MTSTFGASCSFFSSLSVICSSTWRAVAPGQTVRITITLKVNGGSSDCPSFVYERTPNSAITSIA